MMGPKHISLQRHLSLTLEHIVPAAILASGSFVLVVMAQALQHVVEYQLGMYASVADFKAAQNHPLRIGAGLIKVLSVCIACLFIPKALSEAFTPHTIRAAFFRSWLGKIRRPQEGLVGCLVLVVPLAVLHIGLSYFAIAHPKAGVLLALDSGLVGLLVLVMGSAMWASDAFAPRA